MTLLVPLVLSLACLAQAFQIVQGGRAFDRLITIWLGNQDFAKVSEDPHIIDLKREGIFLTKYYALTNASQPNYLAAIGGEYFGLNHDGVVRVPENVSTAVDLLEWKDMSWGGYFEDMPGPGYMAEASDGSTGIGRWDYVRKHNPFVSYDSITNNGSRLLQLRDFKTFQRDFAAGQVPQFVFMSPNMMNNGDNTTLEYASTWAHDFLVPLVRDGAFRERTLILLTYDKSETYGKPNQIASLLLGNAIPNSLKGTTDDTYYTHYSILSTMQYNWELPNLGRYDVGANIFQYVADYTGYQNAGDPDNLASIDNSISYSGVLNNDPSKWIPIPPPNLQLIGAGGLPVLDSIQTAWKSQAASPTPYDGTGEAFDGAKNLPEYVPQAPNLVLPP